MIDFRPAVAEDIPALWDVRTRAVAHSCAAHYSAGILAVWLASPPPASLASLIARGSAMLACEGNHMLGYAVLDAGTGEVDAVFVAPGQQGRGIGRALLAWVEDAARAAGRERLFLSASLNAIPFYRRAGFVAVREEMYPHRSGLAIASVFMEKALA